MNAHPKCTGRLAVIVVWLLTTATAGAAARVQQDWRGRETPLGAWTPGMGPGGGDFPGPPDVPGGGTSPPYVVPGDISVGEGYDPGQEGFGDRYVTSLSNTRLKMVLSSGTTRTFWAGASDGAPNSRRIEWSVDGGVYDIRTHLGSVGVGTHTVTATGYWYNGYPLWSASVTVEVIPEAKQTVKAELTTVKKLAEALTKINQFLGQSDDKTEWTLQGSFSRWNVEKCDIPNLTDVNKSLVFSGGAKLAYEKVYIPGWSITLPYLKAGAWMQPFLTLLMEMSATREAYGSTPCWVFSGGPNLSGSIAGGLGLSTGDPRVIKFEGDVRGTVSASASGKLQGPPVSVNLTGNIGKLTVGGQVKVWLVGQPVATYTIQQTIWPSMTIQTTVSLAGLIS